MPYQLTPPTCDMVLVRRANPPPPPYTPPRPPRPKPPSIGGVSGGGTTYIAIDNLIASGFGGVRLPAGSQPVYGEVCRYSGNVGSRQAVGSAAGSGLNQGTYSCQRVIVGYMVPV